MARPSNSRSRMILSAQATDLRVNKGAPVSRRQHAAGDAEGWFNMLLSQLSHDFSRSADDSAKS